jgi:hypothetical protein
VRIPPYLSPSSIAIWLKNKEEFYLKYLAEDRPPKIPQTKPMALGSAFDAYVKSYLHNALFGASDDFEFNTIFETQVEPQNRDIALEDGLILFGLYKNTGALADLLSVMLNGHRIKFEFAVEGQVSKDNIPFLGKPDAFYVDMHGNHVILDWKVNGYYSKRTPSPKKGYIKVREIGKQSKVHPKAIPLMVNGMMINVGHKLEDVDGDWARQLTIYAWLLGEEVGSNFIVGIDQIVGNTRVAEHRCYVGSEFQQHVLDTAREIWEIINSGYIFRDKSEDESRERCKVLDRQAEALRGTDEWFTQVTRQY